LVAATAVLERRRREVLHSGPMTAVKDFLIKIQPVKLFFVLKLNILLVILQVLIFSFIFILIDNFMFLTVEFTECKVEISFVWSAAATTKQLF